MAASRRRKTIGGRSLRSRSEPSETLDGSEQRVTSVVRSPKSGKHGTRSEQVAALPRGGGSHPFRTGTADALTRWGPSAYRRILVLCVRVDAATAAEM